MTVMNFVQPGDSVTPGEEPIIGPGVRGLAIDRGNKGTWIGLVIADKPGNGDVSRWLDSLEQDKMFVFPNVINPKLRSMLERREFFETEDDDGTVFVRPTLVDRMILEAKAWIRHNVDMLRSYHGKDQLRAGAVASFGVAMLASLLAGKTEPERSLRLKSLADSIRNVPVGPEWEDE